MRDSSSATENKWTAYVAQLARRHDIVAVQEAGEVPSSAQHVRDYDIPDQVGDNWTVREYTWRPLAGLDSTTLACLAARRERVTAVTFADARLKDDDLAYAARTAAAVPGIDHHAVPGGKKTVYYAAIDDIPGLPVTDAPNAYAVTAAIKRAVLAAVAEQQGLGCISPARPGTGCCPRRRSTSTICCGAAGTAGPGNMSRDTRGCGTPPCGPSSPSTGQPPAARSPTSGGIRPPAWKPGRPT
ncbi:hypothetical protein ACH427_29785 [Streptomyces sp. NPDC020379]|uniref:hypothetical protein n=1 Tax=Streptomyces sp. NPDC020379 TaxID=3365071 RepID=UPI0037B16EBA